MQSKVMFSFEKRTSYFAGYPTKVKKLYPIITVQFVVGSVRLRTQKHQ